MMSMSTSRLIIRRLAHRWQFTLCIFFGFMVSSTLVAAAPIFVDSVDRLRTNSAIDNANPSYLNLFVHGPNIQLRDIGNIDDSFQDHLSKHLPDAARHQTRHVMLPMPYVNLPSSSMPNKITTANQISYRLISSRGSIYNIQNLEKHITYIDGVYPVNTTDNNPTEIGLDAVIGERTAFIFDLKVGDTVMMSADSRNTVQIALKIAGVIEPTDKKSEFWQGTSDSMWGNMDVDPPATPSLSVFVTNHAMTEVIAQAFPTTLVSTNWIIFLDKDQLKLWDSDELLSRIEDVDTMLSQLVPGSALFTGIRSLVPRQNNRNLFTKLPLVMLLAFIVFTLLYFLVMTISYLIQQQEHYVTLLRNRGISTSQILQLYSLEGISISIISMILGPMLAYSMVATLGITPMFDGLTGGKWMPVSLNWHPFALSAGIGLIQLGLFVIPMTVGSRTSLVIQRLKLSRPSTEPFIQRYYIDVGMVLVGGIIFWELHDRGEIVTGGLFNDVGINEVLLVGPFLLTLAVTLLFMRAFPLAIQFITGESATIQHMVAIVAFFSYGLRSIPHAGYSHEQLIQSLGLATVIGLYFVTQKIYNKFYKLSCITLQTAIVGVLISTSPVSVSVSMIDRLSHVALISLVAAQIGFIAFQKMAHSLPVWINLSTLRLSRNPYQSSWLILLIVLVTSLGILSTTVGGTLSRSYEDRIRYETGSALRIRDIESLPIEGDITKLKDLFEQIPGVQSISLAYRADASVSSSFSNNRVSLLALETSQISHSLWFRDDFADKEFEQIIEGIKPVDRYEPISIPPEAQTIGMWVNTKEHYDGIYLWAVISDRHGVFTPITLGELARPGWSNISAGIPKNLRRPLKLESIQIFERVFGPAGTPGQFLIDDIYALVGRGSDIVILEDFEGKFNWTHIKTSMIGSDNVDLTNDNVFRGLQSGSFTFGKDTNRGIRGIYWSDVDGSMPILASSSFMAHTGAVRGSSLMLNLEGRTVPVSVVDVLDYFPTLNPNDRDFIVVDLRTMLRYLNIVGMHTKRLTPNEIFIDEMEGTGTSALDSVIKIIGSDVSLYHRESLLDNTRENPLINIGWKLILIVSLAIIFLTAGLGYSMYLLGYMGRYRLEMALLKSLGLSRLQIYGLVGVENLIIITIGLSLGTWAGFQISDVIVNSMAVTETGTHIVPPLIKRTDWNVLSFVYFGMVGFFLTTLAFLIRNTIGLDLSYVTRIEAN